MKYKWMHSWTSKLHISHVQECSHLGRIIWWRGDIPDDTEVLTKKILSPYHGESVLTATLPAKVLCKTKPRRRVGIFHHMKKAGFLLQT
jgi:hypothetical protein